MLQRKALLGGEWRLAARPQGPSRLRRQLHIFKAPGKTVGLQDEEKGVGAGGASTGLPVTLTLQS